MKRRKILWIATIAILIAAVAIGLWAHRVSTDVNRMVANLYQLPADTTAKDLEKKGFLNLTEIQSGRVPEIAAFGGRGDLSKRDILKTFTETGDDLAVKIFVRSRSAALITMVTNYHVKGQFEDGPGRTFRWGTEEVETENSVVEVWLRGYSPDISRPDGEDYLLYCYRK